MGLELNDPSQSGPMHAFGLNDQDDSWLARLRGAESADPLTSLGSYDLLSEIGRGGQGVVYRARDRESRRTVALKRLISGPSAGAHSRRRLDRELETAASLQHAGIVNMVGIQIADGQPVLAMEWINGVSITQWAAGDGERRTPRQIIDIALEVCAALQHAHQRGVIHRDLKPSNILVDAAGHPHILDFGLAKFVEPGPAPPAVEHTALTIGDQFIGTLGYASPEQLACRGDAIDVRSDLYQFGLILYEMLTGRMPFPAASTRAETLGIRENADPPRPSSINRKIDRDLDAIVLKALALDPTDRYQSSDAFAADLIHHRAGEPIVARGPGTGYLLRKLLRRHRFAVAFIATVMALVLIGGAASTVLAVRLASARRHEHQAREVAEQIDAFLQDMLSSADPARSSGADVTARELLDRAGQKLDQQFAQQPQVKAALHETIGRAYLGLGLYEQADDHFQAAVGLLEGEAGDSAALAAGLSGLGELRYAQRRYPEAEQFSRRALELLQNRPSPDEPAVACELNNLGAIRRAQGDLDQAESLLRRALAIRRGLNGEHDLEIAETLNNLGNVLRLRKDFAASELNHREVLAIRSAHLGPKHPLLAQSLDNLGIVLSSQGRVDDARTYHEQALAMYRELLGPDHPDVGISAGNLGKLLFGIREFESAEPLLREGLRIREASFPAGDRYTSALRQTLASCLLALKRPSDAEPLLMQEFRQYEAAAAPGPPPPQDLLNLLVDLYQQTGRPEEAERYRAMLKEQ